jgi:hypothetical protein
VHEFWRFEDGYNKGWEDAKLFAAAIPQSTSTSELGYQERWTKLRAQEHVAEKGSSPNIWEFEHGFMQGFNTATTAMF